MTPKLLALCIALPLLVSACSDSDDDSPSAPEQNPDVTSEQDQEQEQEQDPPPVVDTEARYRVTFSDSWTANQFATNYPGNAHFSGLIGATHNEQVIFWEPGQPATPGVKEVAETGGKGDFEEEITLQIDAGTTQAVVSGGGIGNTPGSASVEFDVNTTYPMITLISMIAPSPDWFVGVGNLDMRDENGAFVESLTVLLAVWDAGTDAGARFASGDQASPGEVIRLLTCQAEDCDFSEGVHRDRQDDSGYIARFTFERL